MEETYEYTDYTASNGGDAKLLFTRLWVKHQHWVCKQMADGLMQMGEQRGREEVVECLSSNDTSTERKHTTKFGKKKKIMTTLHEPMRSITQTR